MPPNDNSSDDAVLVACPWCHSGLGEVGSLGAVAVECGRCGVEWAALAGSLEGGAAICAGDGLVSFHLEGPQVRSAKDPRVVAMVPLQASRPGPVEWIGGGAGVVFRRSRGAAVYAKPVPIVLALATAAASYLWLVRAEVPAVYAILIGALFGIGSLVPFAHIVERIRGRLALAAPSRDRVVGELPILRQLGHARTRIRATVAEIDELTQRIPRLQAIETEMRGLAPEVYGERVERLRGAIELTEELIAANRQLLEAYRHASQLAQVDLKQARLDKLLPSRVADSVGDKFAELRAIEERAQLLTEQLQSNEEVEKMLRAGQ